MGFYMELGTENFWRLEIEKYKVPIVAIQEIRWLGNGNVQSSNSTIFFSGKETGKHEQGVGFVVRNSIMSSIKRFMPVNERLCYLQMAGWNFDICIINGYAPTEDQEEEVKNIFYEDLERLFDSLPNNCIKIIAGDLNAQVGKEQFLRPTIGQESWHSVSNDNGLRLVGFAESKNLIISSTYFPRKNIHKHTWTAPDGKTKSQIDHIIIDKRHRTSIKNVRSYRGADGDTDHFLVIASLSLKLSTIWRKKQQPNTAHKLDRSKLRDQKEIMEYQNKIKEGLNSFNIIQGDLSNVIEWTQIKESLIKAAETLRDTKGKSKNHWFDNECRDAIKNRKAARVKMIQNPSISNLQEYAEFRARSNRIIRQKKRASEKNALNDIESYKKDPKMFFEKCKSIKEGFKSRTYLMTNDDGNLISDPKMIIDKFQTYFENLLNNKSDDETNNTDGSGEPAEDQIYVTVEPEVPEPSLEEIKSIVESLKNNKAPGEDNINPELLKLAGRDLLENLHKTISTTWEQEKLEKGWNTAIICPIYKKGDPKKVENYRGISLLDTAYKVLSIAILHRLEKYSTEIIGEYQCGFMKGKSTTDHIFTLRQVMEKYYEYDKDLHMIFIDFQQAYDSIIRDRLWSALIHFGIPRKLVKLIKCCNSDTLCKVRFLGETSKEFEVRCGLKQGDALSPALFNLALEKVVRDMQGGREMEVLGRSSLLAYADDIVLFGESKTELEGTVQKLILSSKKMGLKINENKTKYMLMSRRPTPLQNVSIDHFSFEQVENFKYLGANINHKNNMHNEIKSRISAANRGYHAMRKMFTSKLLSKDTKKKLYIAYLRPIVMYGCETWSTTQGDENKLLTFERKILRKIYGPILNPNTGVYERRKNADLNSLFNTANLKDFLRSKRLEWAGHVWRAEGKLIKQVLINKPNKKRPVGRPRQRWLDRVKDDLKRLSNGASIVDAEDRELWRTLVEAAKRLNGA
ncbi:hypothetical protein QTP88_000231 [Uroleucon formosanum]